mmetsp:Transcript_18100/g.25575  ORF Transcript_18100/g.25575 Transcript_18100/m.25575 type:complete len:491 (+) Transcript_18100:103-1575(+)
MMLSSSSSNELYCRSNVNVKSGLKRISPNNEVGNNAKMTSSRRTVICLMIALVGILLISINNADVQRVEEWNGRRVTFVVEGNDGLRKNENQNQKIIERRDDNNDTSDVINRSALSNRGDDNIDNSCTVEVAMEPNPPINPIFAASYPGSGAKMTWNLIEALTGLWTGDEWFTNGRQRNVVTIKTHYPQYNGRLVPFSKDIQRVLLLLRHPMQAIPSYHNFLYERELNLPAHSTRAPIDVWIPWRNKHFEEELASWEAHVRYWMDNYSSSSPERLVISYESLVDSSTGPQIAHSIVDFLELTKGVQVNRGDVTTTLREQQDRIDCVWHKIVKYHEQPSINNRRNLISTTVNTTTPSHDFKSISSTQDEEASKSSSNDNDNDNNDYKNANSKFKSEHIPDHVLVAVHPNDPDAPAAVDPNHDPLTPESLRSGPKHKPYSIQQHGQIIQVLRNLLNNYRHDNSDLPQILESYINYALHSPFLDDNVNSSQKW